MIILIPAYKPDESLVRLAQQIIELDVHAEILVVDDGSGSTYVPIFTELAIRGVTIITHPVNRGKGAALRTGLAWARTHRSDHIVVTADADGQHLPRDILRVGAKPNEWRASVRVPSCWGYAPCRILAPRSLNSPFLCVPGWVMHLPSGSLRWRRALALPTPRQGFAGLPHR